MTTVESVEGPTTGLRTLGSDVTTVEPVEGPAVGPSRSVKDVLQGKSTLRRCAGGRSSDDVEFEDVDVNASTRHRQKRQRDGSAKDGIIRSDDWRHRLVSDK